MSGLYIDFILLCEEKFVENIPKPEHLKVNPAVPDVQITR